MSFCSFLIFKRARIYRIQALHSSIDQNMEQVERGILIRLTVQPQLTTRWQLTV